MVMDVRARREANQMSGLILVGDVNLMNVDDPTAPFARIGGELQAADLKWTNKNSAQRS
jgi:hypothetical protein